MQLQHQMKILRKYLNSLPGFLKTRSLVPLIMLAAAWNAAVPSIRFAGGAVQE